jgi:hypothetical protein
MAKNPVGRPSGSRTSRRSPQFNKPAGREYRQEFTETFTVPAPNFDLLTEEDKQELRAKAAAKAEAREKQRAMDAFLEEEEARIERELHPEIHEEQKEIEIDCALYADRIILDGRHYMHGRKYTVGKGKYDSLMDVMHRQHKHYADTHRDPMRALQEAQQAVAKGGSSFATFSASTEHGAALGRSGRTIAF